MGTAEMPSSPAKVEEPGGAVRFALFGAAGRRSGTWRVWTTKRQLDVYVAARTTAGVMKASLHASGSWQHGFVSDERARPFVPPGSSRHADIWQRPDEKARGWTHAYSIILPDSELRAWPASANERGDVVHLPPVGEGHAAAVEIMLAKPTDVEIVDDIFDVACLSLVDGTNVRVLARRVRLTDEQNVWLRTMKSLAMS